MPVHKLGRRSSPDSRDRQYPMRALVRASIFRPWRYYRMGPLLPLDQGATGTCVAHAWCGFMAGAPIMCKVLPDPFALYRKIVLLDDWTDNDAEAATTDNTLLQSGTSVRAAVKFLQSRGIVTSYVWATSAEEIARWILSGQGTVVMGTEWWTGMDIPDPKTGLVRLEGASLGGHAWLLTGYNRVTGVFRAMNSWGTLWGHEGTFKIRYDDLDRLLQQDGEACAATEHKVDPLEL